MPQLLPLEHCLCKFYIIVNFQFANRKVNDLNLELFQRAPVLSFSDRFNIAVNTDYIPVNNSMVVPAQVQVIERVIYDGTNDNVQTVEVIVVADGHTTNPTANQHHQHGKRNFNMIIPDGVLPGMTIPVEAPDGKQLKV